MKIASVVIVSGMFYSCLAFADMNYTPTTKGINSFYENNGRTTKRTFTKAKQYAYKIWEKQYDLYGAGLITNKEIVRFPSTTETPDVDHVLPSKWIREIKFNGISRDACDKNLYCNTISTDLHNLMPTFPSLNRLKSDLPFCKEPYNRSFGVKLQKQTPLIIGGVEYTKCVAVPEWAHGPLARAQLYMIEHYQLKMTALYISQLKYWDRNNPPEQDEIARQALANLHQKQINHRITQYGKDGSLP